VVTHVEVSPYSIAGLLIVCFPFLHLLHLKRSWVCFVKLPRCQYRLLHSRKAGRGTHLAVPLLVLEQLAEVVAAVVALDVFVGVNDTRREVLLVCLTLEDCG
jgi:hypothetical protein